MKNDAIQQIAEEEDSIQVIDIRMFVVEPENYRQSDPVSYPNTCLTIVEHRRRGKSSVLLCSKKNMNLFLFPLNLNEELLLLLSYY